MRCLDSWLCNHCYLNFLYCKYNCRYIECQQHFIVFVTKCDRDHTYFHNVLIYKEMFIGLCICIYLYLCTCTHTTWHDMTCQNRTEQNRTRHTTHDTRHPTHDTRHTTHDTTLWMHVTHTWNIFILQLIVCVWLARMSRMLDALRLYTHSMPCLCLVCKAPRLLNGQGGGFGQRNFHTPHHIY